MHAKLSLLSFMLAITAVACWVAYLQADFALRHSRREFLQLQVFASELIVDDEQKVAAVRKSWSTRNNVTFEFHVPGKVQLCWKETDLTPTSKQTSELKTFSLTPGKHYVNYMYSNPSSRTLRSELIAAGALVLDDQTLFEIDESTQWTAWSCPITGDVDELCERAVDELPLVLLKQLSGQPLLWLQASGKL